MDNQQTQQQKLKKKKLQKIIEGWSNVIFPSEEIKEIANKRASICATCSQNILNICAKCICPLTAKCKSPDETCPLEKW